MQKYLFRSKKKSWNLVRFQKIGSKSVHRTLVWLLWRAAAPGLKPLRLPRAQSTVKVKQFTMFGVLACILGRTNFQSHFRSRPWPTVQFSSILTCEWSFYWKLIVGIPGMRKLLYSPWQTLIIAPIGQLLYFRLGPGPLKGLFFC